MSHTNHHGRSRIGRIALLVSLAAIFAGDSFAFAQQGKQPTRPGMGPSTGRSLLNRQNGTTRTGLSGVKAKLPRPIGNRGSLLPPPPKPSKPARPPSKPGHGQVDRSRQPRQMVGTPRTDGTVRRDSRRDGGGDRDRNGVRVDIDSRNGTRLRGNVGNDNFRGRIDVNPGGVGDARARLRDRLYDYGGYRHHGYHGGYGYPYGYSSSWPYWGLGWSGWGWGWNDAPWSWNGYEPQAVVGQPVYVDPTLGDEPEMRATEQPSRPLTDLEKAERALYEGRAKDAVESYREHLRDTPEDAESMRSLAIALVQEKKVKEAVAMMAMAYEKDVSLVRRPMDPEMVEDGEEGFRDVLRATVVFANKVKSASGYMAVAAMMQAEGRDSLALNMLKKAEAAGLDEKLLAEFRNELDRKP